MYRKDFNFLLEFFVDNPEYLICSLIYVVLGALMLGWGLIGWSLSIVFYAGTLAIVLSPIGEKVLRIVHDIRPLYTKREKDYLLPIFEEVYQQAKAKNRRLNLELCVIDQRYVNACAIGRHTIAVTKGAMETFSEDELKAIIGHEIGHIAKYDTIASLYLFVGNGFYSILILIATFFLNLLDKAANIANNGVIRAIVSFCRFLLRFYLFFFMLFINIVTAMNSRRNEYRADRYSYNLGFGQEMIEALYLLEKINLSGKSSIIAKMIASHPILPKRIAKLEELDEQN